MSKQITTHSFISKGCFFVFLLVFASCFTSVAQVQKNEKKGLYSIKSYPQDTLIVEQPDGNISMQVVIRNPDTLYNNPDLLPEFYGGEEELFKYLKANIKYPELARTAKLQGKVLTEFVIDKDGNIRDVQIIKSPEQGESLAKEAIRVVQNMPKWKPGKHNQSPVNVRYYLPIVFQLD